MRRLLLAWAILGLAVSGSAQTVTGDRLRLATGPCVITSEAGPKLVLSGTCDEITTSAATNLTLSPTGDLVTDPAGNDVFPNLNYDINLGMLSKKYLTLHAAELWVETLVAQNTLATIGGRVLVGLTTTLMEDETAVEGVVLFKLQYNNFVIAAGTGDIGYMEANGKVEFVQLAALAVGEVSQASDYFGFDYGGDVCTAYYTAGRTFTITGSTGNDGTYTVESCAYSAPYTRVTITGEIPSAVVDGYLWYISDGLGYFMLFTRDLDDTGPNEWYAGDALFNTGRAGNGFIDLYSNRGIKSASEAGPTIVGNVRLSGTYNDWAPRWAIGNLNGLYGYGVLTYGAAFGDPSAAWIKIDPTNGVRIGHNVTTKIQLEADGDATFTGQITAASGSIGGWTIGASALTDAAGVVGISSAVTGGDDIRFWAGDATPASAEFRVTEAGALTATSGVIGGWTLGATALTDAAGVVGISSAVTGGDDIRFWAGDATPGSAEFRVSEAGNLNASDADITGTITSSTITGGTIDGATITAGSGDEVTLDNDGITIAQGGSTPNQLKFSGGSYINESAAETLGVNADTTITLTTSGCTVQVNNDGSFSGWTGCDLGKNLVRWADLYLSGDINQDPPDTTDDMNPVVVGSGVHYEKTDGCTGTGFAAFDAESGIVVNCSEPSPEQAGRWLDLVLGTPALASRLSAALEVDRLRHELAMLRAELRELMGGVK